MDKRYCIFCGPKEALKDKHPIIRITAAKNLGKIGDKKEVNPLIQTLKDKKSGVRCITAKALGKIGGKNTKSGRILSIALFVVLVTTLFGVHPVEAATPHNLYGTVGQSIDGFAELQEVGSIGNASAYRIGAENDVAYSDDSATPIYDDYFLYDAGSLWPSWNSGEDAVVVIEVSNEETGGNGNYTTSTDKILTNDDPDVFPESTLEKIPTPTLNMNGSNWINLTWPNLTDTNGNVIGYDIYRSTAPDGTYAVVGFTSHEPATLYFNDTTVSAGVTYYFRLRVAYRFFYSTIGMSDVSSGMTPIGNTPPLAVDISVTNTSVYRGNMIHITANGTDAEDSEADLIAEFQYRDPNEISWNETYLDLPIYKSAEGFWQVNFTPPGDAPIGFYDFRVMFEDSSGDNSSWIEILDATVVLNNPPVITSTPIEVATEDVLYSYDVNATDNDGDLLTFNLTIYPSGMVIDNASGEITWIPTNAHVGENSVQVSVYDGYGAEDSQFIIIDVMGVNNPPIADAGSDETVSAGSPHIFDGSMSTDDEGIVSFAWDMNSSDGLDWDTPDATSDKPSYTYFIQGVYIVTLNVTDDQGAWDMDTILITVEDNIPPNSSVGAISPYIQTSTIELTAQATDEGTGVMVVDLIYRFSSDNSSWGTWDYFGNDTSSPYSWYFDFPAWTGYYEFYSIATDYADNSEIVPPVADAICLFQPTGPPSRPDLNISDSDISFNPSTPNSGEIVEIQITVRNIGNDSATAVKVNIYDGDPDTGGVIMEESDKVDVPSDASQIVYFNWDTTGTSGQHNIYVVLDPDEMIAEEDETNNKAYKLINISSDGDLTLTVFLDPEIVEPEGSVQVYGNITYAHGPPDDAVVKITIVGEDIYWTPTTLPSGDYSTYITAPSVEGTYLVRVNVTIDSYSHQTQEILDVLSFTIADLNISSSNIEFNPSEPYSGETVNILITVKNKGDDDADNVLVSVYDGDPDDSGELIDSFKIDILAGGYEEKEFDWNTTGLSGTHYIHVILDPNGSIVESDETNNRVSRSINISAGGIDSDADGVTDESDAFPLDPAASMDADGDGYPDSWNTGKTQSDSTTGLKLDDFPEDPKEWTDSDGDGVGDNSDFLPDFSNSLLYAILALIIISIVIFMLVIILIRKKSEIEDKEAYIDVQTEIVELESEIQRMKQKGIKTDELEKTLKEMKAELREDSV